ncbi:ECF transporter S component [Dolosicoccus paucivorans]|uniref:Riboflavin transporter n=1 Tax=Dolosicoccus paucivorans TaxID=84521 RepID=A0A1G8M4Q2_9LACT|nr:ECF transporter S component [Dolosicoccus paucivorans]PMB85115.1 ECF transporter S component [Dolosicoccus paucivorans]PMC58917.1 ECF transporter S component [Dolosicoccus paucivorans]SDI62875.1 Riboflavin transporter FmnP [Dolosicoccus paucivorans]
MKKKALVSFVLVALLGTWSFLFRQIDFPLLPAAPFLKMDLSDIPVLVGLMSGGPMGATGVAFIRDLINFLLKGGEMGLPVGATMSFICSLSFYLPLHYYFKRPLPRKASHYLVVIIGSIGLMTVFASLLNYFIAMPLYIKIFNFPVDNILTYVLSVIVPFNLIKGILLAIITYFLIPIFDKLIHNRSYNYYD